MKEKLPFLSGILAGLVLLTGPAPRLLAQVDPLNPGPNEYAKIVAHIIPATSGGQICTSNRAAVKCQDMVIKGGLFPDSYYLFVVATDLDRRGKLGGVEFGIDYNRATRQGVDVFEWKSCGTLEFPYGGWPAPGASNMVTWQESQCPAEEPGGAASGAMGVAGYFYMTAYSADKFKITIRPVSGKAAVATCKCGEECGMQENQVEGPNVHFANSHLGYVSFSAGAVDECYNPCGQAKPVVEGTWSEVKSREN